MGFIEQLSAVAILVDFLFGIVVGLVLGVSSASLREDGQQSLLSAAPDALCDGARVIQDLFVRGYPPVADRVGPGGDAERDPSGREPDKRRRDPDR